MILSINKHLCCDLLCKLLNVILIDIWLFFFQNLFIYDCWWRHRSAHVSSWLVFIKYLRSNLWNICMSISVINIWRQKCFDVSFAYLLKLQFLRACVYHKIFQLIQRGSSMFVFIQVLLNITIQLILCWELVFQNSMNSQTSLLNLVNLVLRNLLNVQNCELVLNQRIFKWNQFLCKLISCNRASYIRTISFVVKSS